MQRALRAPRGNDASITELKGATDDRFKALQAVNVAQAKENKSLRDLITALKTELEGKIGDEATARGNLKAELDTKRGELKTHVDTKRGELKAELEGKIGDEATARGTLKTELEGKIGDEAG